MWAWPNVWIVFDPPRPESGILFLEIGPRAGGGQWALLSRLEEQMAVIFGRPTEPSHMDGNSLKIATEDSTRRSIRV